MMCFNSKATPTINTNYNCHIKAVEIAKPIYGIHITSLMIDSLGLGKHTDTQTHTHRHTDTQTHRHTHTHTDVPHRINFKNHVCTSLWQGRDAPDLKSWNLKKNRDLRSKIYANKLKIQKVCEQGEDGMQRNGCMH